MEFTQEQRKKLGEFTEGIDCAQNFLCYDLKPDDIFRKRTVGLDEYLECIGCTGDDPEKCPFSLIIFGNVYLCTCPVRDYIVKNFGNEQA